MRELKLSNDGRMFIIDDEDYNRVTEYTWYVDFAESDCMYVKAKINEKNVKLHRFILGIDDDRHIDHIDGNGLNNQKENLRVATSSQNAMNRKRKSTGSSKYKGVHFNSDPNARNKWRAQIQFNGKTTHLGSHATEKEAALAYDKAAKELFGEYAKLNF